MSGYIAGFTVYTLAIIGVILLAFVVAKKAMMTGGFKHKKTQFIDVEHTMNIAPRKTLHVIRAGGEKFLIASDVDRTTFLTKLAVDETIQNTFQDELSDTKEETITTEDTNYHQNGTRNQNGILRSILEKIGS